VKTILWEETNQQKSTLFEDVRVILLEQKSDAIEEERRKWGVQRKVSTWEVRGVARDRRLQIGNKGRKESVSKLPTYQSRFWIYLADFWV
jgi:hypothetical protein